MTTTHKGSCNAVDSALQNLRDEGVSFDGWTDPQVQYAALSYIEAGLSICNCK